jgi:hypothetical protein
MFSLHDFEDVNMVALVKDTVKKSAFEDNEFTNDACAFTTHSSQYIRTGFHLDRSCPFSTAFRRLHFSHVHDVAYRLFFFAEMFVAERSHRNRRIDMVNSAPLELEHYSAAPRARSRPCLATELPVDLWNKPALIDFDYWAGVRARLREQGMQEKHLMGVLIC